MEVLGFVVQVLSAISIVVSLVYLAVQIRENIRSMRRAAAREITRDLNDLGRYFIQLPDLNELYLKALGQPDELTVAERFRFERLITHTFSNFQMALEYHQDGLLGDETIEPYGQSVLKTFDSPAVMEWWEREGQFVFNQRFRDLVAERKAT
jgi:hypothetical protein